MRGGGRTCRAPERPEPSNMAAAASARMGRSAYATCRACHISFCGRPGGVSAVRARRRQCGDPGRTRTGVWSFAGSRMTALPRGRKPLMRFERMTSPLRGDRSAAELQGHGPRGGIEPASTGSQPVVLPLYDHGRCCRASRQYEHAGAALKGLNNTAVQLGYGRLISDCPPSCHG